MQQIKKGRCKSIVNVNGGGGKYSYNKECCARLSMLVITECGRVHAASNF